MKDLSIGILAYNHEFVLEDLLDSIFKQVTHYTFDIIIGVDLCSDKTLEVAKNYKKKHQETIYIIEHTSNIGEDANYSSVASELSGRFGMIVDGDDIFLPGKIQKICDMFLSNKKLNLVAHPMVLADNNIELSFGLDKLELPEIFSMEYMVSNYLAFGNSQKAFRMPFNSHGAYMIDFRIDIDHVGADGMIGFINEPLGIKRDYPNSVTDRSGLALKSLVDSTLCGFDEAYGILKSKIILKAKVRYLVAAISGLIKNNEIDLVKHYLYVLNTIDIKGFKLFELFKFARYIPMLQVTCIRIMQTLSSIRKIKFSNHDFSHLIDNYNNNN